MDVPRVAIIVLNYNGRDLLERYLPSITEIDYANYEIIVVDNDSSDGSVRFLQENYPEIRIIEKVNNVGISGGYNAGAEAAPDADYCLFMNNDVRTTPSFLSRLINRVESKQEVGIVFPRVNDMDSETIQTLGYRKDIFGHGGAPPIGKGKQEVPFAEPREIVHGIGAAMLVNRRIWLEIGGFDEGNFIYGSDVYLCLQAWVRGYHVEVVPDSVVYHEEDVTIGNNPLQPYHHVHSKTRTYLKTFQLSTLVVGFPGFVLLLLGQVIKDVTVRRQNRIAAYRMAGFLSALTAFPEIYEHRKQLAEVRKYDDSEFLTPIGETWGK